MLCIYHVFPTPIRLFLRDIQVTPTYEEQLVGYNNKVKRSQYKVYEVKTGGVIVFLTRCGTFTLLHCIAVNLTEEDIVSAVDNILQYQGQLFSDTPYISYIQGDNSYPAIVGLIEEE